MRKQLYMEGNGRITCADMKCAGATAHASGMKRDLNGARIRKVTPTDVKEWLLMVGEPMKCEGCGAEASLLIID
jgi:hypothetical protein